MHATVTFRDENGVVPLSVDFGPVVSVKRRTIDVRETEGDEVEDGTWQCEEEDEGGEDQEANEAGAGCFVFFKES